jgi:predicted enzyme related to lactoylglutathione lyase
MDRAIRFYTRALGGRLKFRGRGGMRNFWAWVELGGSDIWLIAPDKREKRTLAYSTLIVTNIKRTVTRLQSKGVKFRRPERMSQETKIDGPIAYESVGASAFFKDSEGNLLMIWQNNPPL